MVDADRAPASIELVGHAGAITEHEASQSRPRRIAARHAYAQCTLHAVGPPPHVGAAPVEHFDLLGRDLEQRALRRCAGIERAMRRPQQAVTWTRSPGSSI